MKNLVILTLLLAVLGTFVYFYEIAGEEEEETRKLEGRLIRLERGEIDGLKIVRTGSPTVVLRRDGEGWSLKEPLETVADSGTVESLMSSLEDAQRERTFDAGGKSLAEYGLVDPDVSLAVEKSGESHVLLIGNKDYTGNQLYVKFEEEPRVYLTSNSVLNSIDKDLMDWRDKSILSFNRYNLQEFRIQRASDELVFVKEADQWSLDAPIKEPADGGTVSSLLSSLETGKALKFITEHAEELAEFGLENPSIVVGVREEGEDTWRQLELGSQNEDEEVYARNPLRSAVFTVEKDVFKDLFQEVWEFRSKDVIDVEQDEIVRLMIDRTEGNIVVRHEDYKWIVEAPEDDKDKEVLAYKFWYPIDDIEFESILDETLEFPKADIQILLTLKDGSERRFEFAKRGDEYLARQVESGRRGEISEENFEKLDFKLEEITG